MSGRAPVLTSVPSAEQIRPRLETLSAQDRETLRLKTLGAYDRFLGLVTSGTPEQISRADRRTIAEAMIEFGVYSWPPRAG